MHPDGPPMATCIASRGRITGCGSKVAISPLSPSTLAADKARPPQQKIDSMKAARHAGGACMASPGSRNPA